MAKKVSNKQLAEALFKTVQGLKGEKLHAALKGFVSFLAKAHKLRQADRIIAEFIHYSKKQEGIKEVEITAARKLDEKTLDHIRKSLGGKMEEQIVLDENILGGVKIKTDDTILDASIRTQLNCMKNILS